MAQIGDIPGNTGRVATLRVCHVLLRDLSHSGEKYGQGQTLDQGRTSYVGGLEPGLLVVISSYKQAVKELVSSLFYSSYRMHERRTIAKVIP